ncbi:MAG: asparagine--tRNA ligase [Acidimicrobiaceae bacterium]|nr:asparagine--tRNA ligase [Acidimicrobiaceae bacterium]
MISHPLKIDDAITLEDGTHVNLQGWIVRLRKHGSLTFFDLENSKSSIQCVVSRELLKATDGLQSLLKPEAAIVVEGKIATRKDNPQLPPDLICEYIEVVGPVIKPMSPSPRTADLDASGLTDHKLTNQHMYMRNPKIRAAMLLRHELLGFFHRWFRENDFVEFTAPVLTPIPIYQDKTAIDLEIHGENVFLTQCVGFYLEAAIHGLDRVYNIGPSFRKEKSRGRRHLMEYWHIKAGIAFCDRERMMGVVEDLIQQGVAFSQNLRSLISTFGGSVCKPLPEGPFPRISYREACGLISETTGKTMQFGSSLSPDRQNVLGTRFDTPFWVVGMPRTIEPFPYVIDPDDDELTMTADLLAPGDYGELLGVAEKISDLAELDERMLEKGREKDSRYQWVRDLRNLGAAPQAGFGLGFERFLRWIAQGYHVRDFIGFPRMFGRKIHP